MNNTSKWMRMAFASGFAICLSSVSRAETCDLKVDNKVFINGVVCDFGIERWSRLSEQNLRVDKWSVCQC
jgi:hypothetical protein